MAIHFPRSGARHAKVKEMLFTTQNFNIKFETGSAVGGIIVLTCVIIIGLRKWISTLPEDRNQRRRLRFLLH